jgi:hypothetical protein
MHQAAGGVLECDLDSGGAVPPNVDDGGDAIRRQATNDGVAADVLKMRDKPSHALARR